MSPMYAAPDPLKVEVTQRDCDDGCRNSERYCVVSTAIQRLFPDANRVETNVNTIRFSIKVNGRTFRVAYPTPDVVAEYVRNFDAGEDATPMKFVATNPQVVEKKPTPKGKAKTPSMKPQESAKSRRSIRVFGEKAFGPVEQGRAS